ncbi:hypothetical protein [Sedimentitalea sp.]|uniref:hypothetical protein n=1 Tax=Sedimentitalea sp. TaxID=2048915 RepID=UPI003297E98B
MAAIKWGFIDIQIKRALAISAVVVSRHLAGQASGRVVVTVTEPVEAPPITVLAMKFHLRDRVRVSLLFLILTI